MQTYNVLQKQLGMYLASFHLMLTTATPTPPGGASIMTEETYSTLFLWCNVDMVIFPSVFPLAEVFFIYIYKGKGLS